jgi:hypothetical protein
VGYLFAPFCFLLLSHHLRPRCLWLELRTIVPHAIVAGMQHTSHECCNSCRQ